MGEGQPAAHVGQRAEPPGRGFVAGAVLIVVKGDEDARSRTEAVNPFLPATPGRGAGGHHGNGGGDTVATSLGYGQGIDLAFDKHNRLVNVQAVGVVQGVAETAWPKVLRLPGGDLGRRYRPAHVDAPKGAAGEPGNRDATGDVDAMGWIGGWRQTPFGM